MKSRSRAVRGSVKVEPRSGILYLRCHVAEKRHTFSLRIPDSPLTRHEAQKIAKQAELDILRGEFDPTYQKYRGQMQAPIEPAAKQSTIALWQRWVDHQRSKNVAEQTLNSRYKAIGTHLKAFGQDLKTENDARKLLDQLGKTQGAQTRNRSLKMLQAFSAWAFKLGWIDLDPFVELQPVRAAKPPQKKPFSLDEIDRIKRGFKTHPDYFCYSDFVTVFLGLGLRPSEVIGLQWKRVNFEAGTIEICDALGRGPNGESAGSSRVRRPRKTGNRTVLKLSPPILAVLQGRHTREQQPNDLIFTVRGKAIDDRNFRSRPWTIILKLAAVDYRPPYNLRHTMASHALDQRTPPGDIAKMLGHTSLRMVNEVYGHSVNDLPEPPDMGL
jgi:integrase